MLDFIGKHFLKTVTENLSHAAARRAYDRISGEAKSRAEEQAEWVSHDRISGEAKSRAEEQAEWVSRSGQ